MNKRPWMLPSIILNDSVRISIHTVRKRWLCSEDREPRENNFHVSPVATCLNWFCREDELKFLFYESINAIVLLVESSWSAIKMEPSNMRDRECLPIIDDDWLDSS